MKVVDFQIDETTCSAALAPPANVAIMGRGSVGDRKWGKKMLNNNKLIKGRKKPANSFSNWGGGDYDPFADSKKKKIKESALEVSDIKDSPFVQGFTICYDDAIVFSAADDRIYHMMDARDGSIEIVRNFVNDDYSYEIANVPMVGSLADSYNKAISWVANNKAEFQKI